ncbi:MAG: zapE [Gammaproteobacteria bacterium]|jgi:cell division protein ZapE|nr:zapE [Gammaproteobacteria bacterium]
MTNRTPLDYYKEQCKAGTIIEDPQQLAALQSFQRVYQDLIVEYKKRSALTAFFRPPRHPKGLYIWGGVGIGKTFLMDCFFHSLPFKQKMRMHFHQFMQRIHQALTQHQGESNPLDVIASELAKETYLLCFDEFYVSDIADAMILGGLLKALFARGVCFVCTSNIMPDELYKYGLQRLQFLSAIALIKENVEVVNIQSTRDYRLRHLKEAGIFYTPLGKTAQENMEKTFAFLAKGQPSSEAPVMINERPINIKKQAGELIWFDFKEICKVPRSQKDYLVIAEKYRTVFISDIPIIPPNEKDTICLFICLVDVLYDARVKLVISAAEPVAEIYSKGFMILEYTRTHSRLLEMQSQDYFTGEEGK